MALRIWMLPVSGLRNRLRQRLDSGQYAAQLGTVQQRGMGLVGLLRMDVG